MPLTDPHGRLANQLRAALEQRFTAAAVDERLGEATEFVLNAENGPARAAAGTDALGAMIRLFLLGDWVDEADAALALDPLDLTGAMAGGLLTRLAAPAMTRSTAEPGAAAQVRCAVMIRPVVLPPNHREVWLVSDFPDQIASEGFLPGLGGAPLTLLGATPPGHFGSVWDLGTGTGVQALAADADRIVATDINPRALDLAGFAATLNQVDIELRNGSWAEPVSDELFDLIVANPPFVVGPATTAQTYRDSGLDLDGATETAVAAAANRLGVGGTAIIAGTWVSTVNAPWPQRIASWFAPEGLEVWVLGRGVASPSAYVREWLRDAGVSLASAAGQRREAAWVGFLAANEVTEIVMGTIAIRRRPAPSAETPSAVVAEWFTQPYVDPLGPEIDAHFARAAWLADADLGRERFALTPHVRLERSYQPDPEGGWSETDLTLRRLDGPAWEHVVDSDAAALLGGLIPGGLVLDDVIDLLALSRGEEPDAIRTAAYSLVRDLYRHGFLATS